MVTRDNTLERLAFNQRTGLCPVCKQRPSGVWPDGTPHITCGAFRCFYRWVMRKKPPVRWW